MSTVLNMAQSLLDLGRESLQAKQFSKGLRILRGLLALPDVPPSIAAEAHYLMAEIHFGRSEFNLARDDLSEALQEDPANPEYHFLFAKSSAYDEECDGGDALTHFAAAAELAPADGRKASQYALSLTRNGDHNTGLALLEQTYCEHGTDPEVVEDFVDGLIEADQMDLAELAVVHASHRNADDKRFTRVRRRFQQKRLETQIEQYGRRTNDIGEPSILPFRSFGVPDSPKPRGQKKPRKRGGTATTERLSDSKKAPPSQSGPAILHEQTSLAQILKKMRSAYIANLYASLGLLGKKRPHLQRAEIAKVLLQHAFLNKWVKRLPKDGRKLLRTLVAAGGYLPASVLFQNTGPDAPPPDYAQPLTESGILYFGRKPHAKSSERNLVAVIPVDLMEKLATVLGITFDD